MRRTLANTFLQIAPDAAAKAGVKQQETRRKDCGKSIVNRRVYLRAVGHLQHPVPTQDEALPGCLDCGDELFGGFG